MFTFILALILAASAYGLWRLKQRAARGEITFDRDPVPPGLFRVSAIIVGILAVVCLLVSFTVRVGTKEVGVVTTFGKPVGHLSNGIHLKWPWQSVTELDGAIQTDSENLTVRMTNQYRGTIPTTIQWRINGPAADTLYQDYRSFSKIQEYVLKQLNNSMNETFASYDPLSALSTQGNSTTVEDAGLLGSKVAANLQQKLGDQIAVLNVITPNPTYDDATEKSITQYQQAIADTRTATQRKQTAQQEAAANRILASSVSHSPNVLVSKCFDTLTSMIKAGQPVPAGFSCWPGGGTGVVIPSK